MAQKIYTKTGDKGSTSLIGGRRVSKSLQRIDAYGTIDELNAWIGFVKDTIQRAEKNHVLTEIQDRLFVIGALLAYDPENQMKPAMPNLHETDIHFLESEIDNMSETLPDLEHFILPGGHVAVSATHVARTVCLRAERTCVKLKTKNEHTDDQIVPYLNRLSDYLFVLSRYVGKFYAIQEIAWIPRT